jgi:hypothetical protein
VDGYKVNLPEALKDRVNAEDLAKSDDFKAFMGKMHGLNLSQKQLDGVVAELTERGIKMREAMPVLDAAEAESTLRQVDGWKTDAEYRQQIGTAFSAGKAIFGADFDGILKDYGNDARLIKGLASIGKEMGEDTQASPEAQAQMNDNLDQLMSSKAFLNANDPQHFSVRAKVDALTARIAGTRPVASGRTHTFKTG